MLVGFLGTAWFAVILVLLRYLIAFDPEKNPFQSAEAGHPDQGTEHHVWVPNYIDVLLLKSLRALGRKVFSCIGELVEPFKAHLGWLPNLQGWLLERLQWDKAFTKVSCVIARGVSSE